MGMYTGVLIEVWIYPGDDGLAWLQWALAGGDSADEPRANLGHRFFRQGRRTFLLRGYCAYFPELRLLQERGSLPILRRNRDGGPWLLRAAIAVKNYNGEVEDWIDWLCSIAESGYVMWRYEEHEKWNTHEFGRMRWKK